MQSHRDEYIHELTVKKIEEILKSGAWQSSGQSLTSAVTNDNCMAEPDPTFTINSDNTAGPNAFADINFGRKVKRVLDIGGGRFDTNRDYMQREKKIELSVWDPYNRTPSHNAVVQSAFETNQADAVTSMSVLNVIPEVKVRLMHLTTVKAALKTGGMAYFKIWPGEEPLLGTYLPSAKEDVYQANAYADRFLREIEIVFGAGNVEVDNTVPNLIVAKKQSAAPTSRQEILQIQESSKQELVTLTEIRKESVRSLNSKALKSIPSNLSIFRKMEDQYIQNNRHTDPRLQQEYDKRHGLIIVKKQ